MISPFGQQVGGRFRTGAGLVLSGTVLLGVTVLGSAAQATTAVSFRPPITYSKAGATGLGAADFDGDGKVDLAVGGSDSLSIFYGNGDGTLQPSADYEPGSGFNRVIAVDVDGDGRLDLVAADSGSNTVDVLINQGGRVFAPAVTYPAGSFPDSVVAADFNGDGKPDLAVSNAGSNQMCILINNGNGTFGAAQFYGGGNTPTGIVAGDWNGDGKVDLAMSNDVTSDVDLYLGDGLGAFSFETNLVWNGDYHTAIAVADFNGDGKPDLAVPEYWGGGMAFLFGNGDGSFQSPVDYGANQFPLDIHAADLDLDGRPDLVIPNAGTNYITVLQNTGAGVFAPGVTFTSGVGNTRSMAIGDFNGDGVPDVAVAADTSNAFAILLNTTNPIAAVSGLTLTPSTAIGGAQSVAGSINLSRPAPSGGAVVAISNTNPAATAPATVRVPEGASQASFTIATAYVSSPRTGTVTATLNGGSQSAPLTVLPIGVSEVEIIPDPVAGGKIVSAQATLKYPAGPGGITVTLTSSDPSVAAPQVGSITIPAGAINGSFKIKTRKVSTSTNVTIAATANGIAAGKVLTVTP